MRTAHAKAELRKRREHDFWRAANRSVVVLISLAILVLAAYAFLPEMRRLREMKDDLAGLQKDLKVEELRLLQQQREERWLNENPEYVETIARDRLGVMKEGETILRLDEKPAASPPAATPQ